MSNASKKTRKLVIHYNDGKQYTIKNVEAAGVNHAQEELVVQYYEGNQSVTRNIWLYDTFYTEYFDEFGDLHIFNATTIPLKVILQDRTYRKMMQTTLTDVEGKTLSSAIKEIKDVDVLSDAPEPPKEAVAAPQPSFIAPVTPVVTVGDDNF